VIPIVDGHNDALLRVRRSGAPLAERGDGQLDLPRMREGGIAAGFFAIFVPAGDEPPPEDPRASVVVTDDGWEVPQEEPLPRERARQVADEMARIAERELFLVRTVADLERCLAGEETGAILHLEGAEPLDPAALRDELDAWYGRGLRSLGIVWSRANAYGNGVPFRYPAGPDVGPGLTDAGKELVSACNALGILVDCAHLNERGFFDVAERSTAPLVVTHAGVNALSPQPRNLTDRQLDAIRDSNGLVGIFFDTVMTRPDGNLDTTTPLETIAAHVNYVVERIGVEHVALGSDWDGCHPPTAIDDASKGQALLDVLAWSDADLRKLAHENWLRVFAQTWRA
jgi:membrane dipeptidase